MNIRQLFLFLLFLSLFQSVPFTEATEKKTNQTLQILCLGDSITQSNEEYCGYRYSLWKKLVDHKIDFNFIGSMNKRYYELPSRDCGQYKGESFDPDHEGHWGWRADQILGMAAEDIFPDTGHGQLSEWLQRYTPDIVLMHLGHNDAGWYETPEQMVKDLKEIIFLLQKDNPHVSILLAKVIPNAKPKWNAQLAILNAEIDGIAKDVNTPASRVVVIDFTNGFDPLKDTTDGTHPNAIGSEKMADKWFKGILKLMEK